VTDKGTFAQGAAWAIALMSRDDSPSCRDAQFLFNEAGLTASQYKKEGVDEYDLSEVRKVENWKLRKHRKP
jgi:hypothetical protein